MTDEPLDTLRSEFLRLISHELRTPLTGIRGYTDLLGSERTGPLNDVQRQMLAMIGFCVHRLDSLVEDLLVLASIDAGLFGLVLEPVEPTLLCDRVLKSYAPGRVVLRAEYADGLPVLDADPRQLERLLVDLLDNAVRHSPEGGTVLLRVEPERKGLRIAVTADGGGTPRDDSGGLLAHYLHEAATGEAHAAGRRDTGDAARGLGLTVVRAIADHHGGTLTAHTEGARVTVAVSLPVHPPAGGRTVMRHERPRTDRPREWQVQP
ncbi:sensor histidine kinase [Virgisporangium aliadipatigenens]|nr:HAMP domain-containing sensor histidine kinase [Virgisporangium aliadipatigenens]